MEAKTQPPTLQESTIIERIARIVSHVRGAKPDYAQLAAELEPAIPFDVFGIVLLRHDRQAVRVTVCTRTADGWSTQYHQHPFAESKLEQLVTAPVFSVHTYPQGIDGPPAEVGDALSGFPHLQATLLAPLIVDEHVLGTLELGSTLPHVYADETLQRLIQAVVHVLASAIQSAQVGGSVEIQDRQRQALKQVSSALTSEMDLPLILHRIVVGISEALHVASAIVTVDSASPVGTPMMASAHDSTPLQLQAHSGVDPALLHTIIRRPAAFGDQSIIGYSLRHHQPIVSHDIATDERFPASGIFASELAVHSLYSYPLVIGETVYGTLLLCSPEPGGFTPLKADILSLFAGQATLAIYHGLLHQEAQQRQRFHAAPAPQGYSLQGAPVGIPSMASAAEQAFERAFPSLLPEALHRVPASAALIGHFSTVTDSAGHTLLDTLTQQMADAWFIVSGQEGRCLYLNPVAELVCGMPLPFAAQRPLHDLFASLLPRARQAEELSSYLYDFTTAPPNSIQGRDPMNRIPPDAIHRVPTDVPTLRCTFAAEPVGAPFLTPTWKGDAMNRIPPDTIHRVPTSSPSDQHYQLTRIPFYDAQGALIFSALRMHDITTQVRDEKNKSVLLSSISHDLRTPLTAIKAAVTGLLQPGIVWDEDMRREILEDIDAETDHLGALVNSLVEMSRIEMGALVLEKEWCDIVEIVHATLSRLEHTLGDRSVRTHFGSADSPHLPLLFADYVQLGRVFHNLLENAIRYSPDGTTIFVSIDVVEAHSLPGSLPPPSHRPNRDGVAMPSHAPTSYVRTRIIDSGPGIPESERERIFNTFYSLDASGSGLGLAICRGIIEAHGGRIWVEPPPEHATGSSFVFLLPLSSPKVGRDISGVWLPSDNLISPQDERRRSSL